MFFNSFKVTFLNFLLVYLFFNNITDYHKFIVSSVDYFKLFIYFGISFVINFFILFNFWGILFSSIYYVASFYIIQVVFYFIYISYISYNGSYLTLLDNFLLLKEGMALLKSNSVPLSFWMLFLFVDVFFLPFLKIGKVKFKRLKWLMFLCSLLGLISFQLLDGFRYKKSFYFEQNKLVIVKTKQLHLHGFFSYNLFFIFSNLLIKENNQDSLLNNSYLVNHKKINNSHEKI